MSLPRYLEYKDCEVVWLGELPTHWTWASLKWLCKRYSGGTPDKAKIEYWEDGTIPWLNSGSVNSERISEASAYITEEAFRNSSAKWIPVGSLLMALAGQGKTKGMVAQLMFEATCNQSMAAIVPNQKIKARYLYWWLTHNYQNIRNMAGGDLRDGLNLELLGSIPCPLPSEPEQTAISTFLDRETVKIDALVVEQEKLIALLAEKRQAIITHAVTRGLNPNVPMKDSGVAWLGQVPAHWKISTLGRVAVDRCDGPFGSGIKSEHYKEEGALVVRLQNIRSAAFNMGEPVYLDERYFLTELRGHEVLSGDVLVAGLGDENNLLGRACVAPEGLGKALVKADCFRFRLDTDKASPDFIAFQLSAGAAFDAGILATGTTRSRIPLGTMATRKVAFPDVDEQATIVGFIRRETARLDGLKGEAERGVALLKERRSALIAAAVTGQIDVRGAVAESAKQKEAVAA